MLAGQGQIGVATTERADAAALCFVSRHAGVAVRVAGFTADLLGAACLDLYPTVLAAHRGVPYAFTDRIQTVATGVGLARRRPYHLFYPLVGTGKRDELVVTDAAKAASRENARHTDVPIARAHQ